jgi:adenylate cyclase
MDLFRQALIIDPKAARAWAGLALSHAVLFRTAADHHRDQAAEAAAGATELDPRSAEAWTARSAAAAIAGDFAGAAEAFSRAIACDPACFEAHYYFGHACIEVGEYQRAVDIYERAAALRPDDYQALVFARTAYRSLAQQEHERSAAMRQLAAAERALAADSTDARALSLSAGSLITLGRVAEARAWTLRACDLEPEEPYVHYNAACALARLGETEQALAALERATEAGELCRTAWVEHDEDLASLRDHPRFKALLGGPLSERSSRRAVTAAQ